MSMSPPPPGSPGGPHHPPPPPHPGAAPTVVTGGYPPPPGGERRKRWLPWVAALVVLLLIGGGAATWAVLANDDDDSAGGTAEPEPIVTGDLDGNGYGDLLVTQMRSDGQSPTRVWTMPSDGSELADPTDGPVGNGQWLDLADVDGDGLVDQVWTPVTGDPDKTLVVEVVPAEGDPWTAEFPIDRALYGDLFDVSMGDVTGDGRSDLIITNEFIDDRILGVHVAVAEDGGFAAPEQWYSAPTDASFWGAHVGDGNGDGITDVFALTMWEKKGDEGNWENELQLLTSDGSELTAAAEPLQVWGLGLQRQLQGLGDIDGDGDDDPLLANPEGLFTVDVTGEGDTAPRQVYEHELPDAEWRGSIRDFAFSNEFWTVADADGDGTDDVVHMRPDGQGATVDVYRGGPEGLAAPEQWGFFPCAEDACGDSWQAAWPAR